MKPSDIPFNLELMHLTPQKLQLMKPVTVLDIMEGGTQDFHDDGLFSTSIFGRVGSEERDKRFSYIDIRTRIFHPFIYKNLVKLKGLYRGIMEGRAYAKWDDKEKDFVQSDELHGNTGFAFFVSHWKDIDFKSSGSDIRDVRVRLINKYKDVAMTDKILVLPAGLRDIEYDEGGQLVENEVNVFYRDIISISNTLPKDTESSLVDPARISLQRKFVGLYDYFTNLIGGKDKFIQKKWGSRKTFNGTRNVITAMDTSIANLDDEYAFGPNHTMLGLFQAAKGLLPHVKYHLRTGFLSKVFLGSESRARLVDMKTLKSTLVDVKPETIDRWTTNDGLEKLINYYEDQHIRSRPIVVEGHYLGLVYLGPDMTFKVFHGIEELPEGFSKDNVHPITYVELLYLSMYNKWGEFPTYVTRYPVTGDGSTYPSYLYVKTTIVSERRRELGEDWKPLEGNHLAIEYPKYGETEHHDSQVPHPSRYAGLGADHDGDMCSANIGYDEATKKEVDKYLNSRVAYVTPEGRLRASPSDYVTKIVVKNMTG